MDLNLISVAKIIWLNTVFYGRCWDIWLLDSKTFYKLRKNLWSRYPSNYLAHNIRWQENKIYMFQEVASDFTEPRTNHFVPRWALGETAGRQRALSLQQWVVLFSSALLHLPGRPGYSSSLCTSSWSEVLRLTWISS